MSWTKDSLKKLQNKPYRTKIKILWTAVGVVAIAVIILWVITINLRDRAQNPNAPIINELRENLDKLRQDNPFKN